MPCLRKVPRMTTAGLWSSFLMVGWPAGHTELSAAGRRGARDGWVGKRKLTAAARWRVLWQIPALCAGPPVASGHSFVQ